MKITNINKKWILFDATNKILGRLACNITEVLIGKNNPHYTYNNDSGDYVIVINTDKIILTGKKWEKKKYYKHSEYPGNIKITPINIFKKNTEFILRHAIKGMLPKNKLQKIYLKKLKLYSNNIHPHQGQNPIFIKN